MTHGTHSQFHLHLLWQNICIPLKDCIVLSKDSIGKYYLVLFTDGTFHSYNILERLFRLLMLRKCPLARYTLVSIFSLCK